MKNKKEKRNIKDTLSVIGYITLIVILLGGFIFSLVHEKYIDKKYGKTRYEFVITDKYDDIGSAWHLVGGRASEQKYHIVYRYRLTNRPDQDDNMKWYKDETTVSGSRYRNLKVGQTLYGNSMFFPY